MKTKAQSVKYLHTNNKNAHRNTNFQNKKTHTNLLTNKEHKKHTIPHDLPCNRTRYGPFQPIFLSSHQCPKHLIHHTPKDSEGSCFEASLVNKISRRSLKPASRFSKPPVLGGEL